MSHAIRGKMQVTKASAVEAAVRFLQWEWREQPARVTIAPDQQSVTVQADAIRNIRYDLTRGTYALNEYGSKDAAAELNRCARAFEMRDAVAAQFQSPVEVSRSGDMFVLGAEVQEAELLQYA